MTGTLPRHSRLTVGAFRLAVRDRVDLGDFPLARAHCAEAFTIAVAVGDSVLAAWVRGTESLCAYYAGDYRLALELARDGHAFAGGPRR